MKRSLIFAAAVFIAAFAAWRFSPEKAIKKPVLSRMPAAPVEKPAAPLAASAPAPEQAPARKKASVAKTVAKPPLKIGKLVIEEDEAAKSPRKPDLFSSTLVSKDRPNVNLDLGGRLPWPLPDSPWMQKSRDLGFHVGLDYRLNENFELTGIAGVSVPAGTDAYSIKPNVEQIGVRARIRF